MTGEFTNQNARRLRRRMTFPERKLWSLLRGRSLAGLKFRRQHPIGRCITDFACEQEKLVIELDGDSHDGQFEYDKNRQTFIESQGYKVVRFGNDDVLRDEESVLNAILLACGIDPESPHPNPLPQGEGTKRRALPRDGAS